MSYLADKTRELAGYPPVTPEATVLVERAIRDTVARCTADAREAILSRASSRTDWSAALAAEAISSALGRLM